MVDRANLVGCCAASYFYNLGGAHGHAIPKDQDAFDKQIERHFSSVNVAILNDEQTKVRRYMEHQGWTFSTISGLDVGTVSASTLRDYFNKKKAESVKEKLKGSLELDQACKQQDVEDICLAITNRAIYDLYITKEEWSKLREVLERYFKVDLQAFEENNHKYKRSSTAFLDLLNLHFTISNQRSQQRKKLRDVKKTKP